MLKCQFHTHSSEDPCDYIAYSAKDLIKKASELKYDVLAITCHRKLVYSKKLQKYAQKKGILLIPGIEFEIDKKHILGINTNREIEKVDSFEKLRNYKKQYPDCLIIAPHPFFPGKDALKKDLINNIDLFDAIEYSFCYTKTKDYNKKAVALAKRWHKPIITTSDCHILKYLDLGYTLIKAEKNTKSIINAIKKQKIKLVSKPISYFKIASIISSMIFRTYILKKSLKRN